MPPSGKPPALVLKLRSSVPAQYVILKSFSSWNRRDLLGWLLLLCLRHHHHHCIYSLDNWLVQVIGNLANLCPLLQNIFLRLGGKDISDLDKKPMPQPSYRQTTDKSETSRESGNSETSTAAAANSYLLASIKIQRFCPEHWSFFYRIYCFSVVKIYIQSIVFAQL